jgi:hypothetical protein
MITQTTIEFLDAVKNDEVLSLDKNNFIQKATDNFDSDKMNLLANDVGHYLLKFKEQISKEQLIAYRPDQDKNNGFQPTKITLTSTDDYYASTIKRIRILGASIKARVLLKALNAPDNLIEEKTPTKSIEEPEPLIDLSKSKCTEKIIYLKEMGVLDFLIKKEPFNKSIRKLAKALVPILGERYDTIQPILNPVISNYSSKNNPYYNSSTQKVDQIREHLVHLGVTFDNEK